MKKEVIAMINNLQHINAIDTSQATILHLFQQQIKALSVKAAYHVR
ncbi:hypothetical protein HZB02_05150 [Candidatus Woesearchaeota archaeon]|nr:hypothetical protein [Candidatus Woesearchaeota archaeon]